MLYSLVIILLLNGEPQYHIEDYNLSFEDCQHALSHIDQSIPAMCVSQSGNEL
ncbi:hypothetical protein [Vibrio phage 33Fb.4]|nr:hypothetical protein ValLY3_93 [Vibrio phage ValLY_3]UCW44099.1 hypothetical protein [Vibrio phage F23s1]UYE96218.1 hypothetical protein [Vibrio phage 31Fb.4]WAG58453.1 hypothetical protein [Vibrio phage 33Fb.4]